MKLRLQVETKSNFSSTVNPISEMGYNNIMVNTQQQTEGIVAFKPHILVTGKVT